MDAAGIRVPRRFYIVVFTAATLFAVSTILIAVAIGLFSRESNQQIDVNSQKIEQAARDQRIQRQASREICVAINNLNGAITSTLQRSMANLDSLSYYRDHPDEREAQREQIEETIETFSPRKC